MRSTRRRPRRRVVTDPRVPTIPLHRGAAHGNNSPDGGLGDLAARAVGGGASRPGPAPRLRRSAERPVVGVRPRRQRLRVEQRHNAAITTLDGDALFDLPQMSRSSAWRATRTTVACCRQQLPVLIADDPRRYA